MKGLVLEKLKPFGVMVTPSGYSQGLTIAAKTVIPELIKKEKLVLLRNFAPLAAKNDFLSLSRQVIRGRNKLLYWDFGPLMELRVKRNNPNYIFSAEKVPFHWDGAFHKVPRFLCFYCLKSPEESAGGLTLFTNTEKIWESATTAEKSLWTQVNLEYSTDKIVHYGGKICGPLVQTHPETGRFILRYAESVQTIKNPVSMKVAGISKELEFELINRLQDKIYAKKFCYRHKWQNEDLLIADNHALIHGRTAFKETTSRHILRVQIM